MFKLKQVYAGITWNGINTTSLGLKMPVASSQFALAFNAITLNQINGSSEASIMSNGRMDNVTQPFNFTADADKADVLHRRVAMWLVAGLDAGQYQSLFFDGYPDYFFKAVIKAVTPFTFSEDGLEVSFSITFSMKPKAYEISGDHYLTILNGTNLVNNYPFTSQPLFHVKGTGNGSFDLNGITFAFLAISSDLFIDSETEEVYDSNNNYVPNQVQFVNYEFPKLIVGDNRFDNLNNVTLEVKPRWETVL